MNIWRNIFVSYIYFYLVWNILWYMYSSFNFVKLIIMFMGKWTICKIFSINLVCSFYLVLIWPYLWSTIYFCYFYVKKKNWKNKWAFLQNIVEKTPWVIVFISAGLMFILFLPLKICLASVEDLSSASLESRTCLTMH